MTNKHDERVEEIVVSVEDLAAYNYNLYLACTVRRADTGEDWTFEQADKEFKGWLRKTLHTRSKEVREQTLAEVREVIANKKTREMQSGENLGKYKAFQRGEEHMRSKLLDTLENK